MKITAKWWK